MFVIVTNFRSTGCVRPSDRSRSPPPHVVRSQFEYRLASCDPLAAAGRFVTREFRCHRVLVRQADVEFHFRPVAQQQLFSLSAGSSSLPSHRPSAVSSRKTNVGASSTTTVAITDDAADAVLDRLLRYPTSASVNIASTNIVSANIASAAHDQRIVSVFIGISLILFIPSCLMLRWTR